jgi:hypothetical protein
MRLPLESGVVFDAGAGCGSSRLQARFDVSLLTSVRVERGQGCFSSSSSSDEALRFREGVTCTIAATFFAARGSLSRRLPALETRVKLVIVLAAESTCLALAVLAILEVCL